MISARTKSRLLSVAWSVCVPVAVVSVFLGLGVAIVSVVGDPILATVVLGCVTIAAVGVVRLARPRWLAYEPEPDPELRFSLFDYRWTVAICSVLAFVAGQVLGLWLYAMVGSAGFDQSVRIKRDAGPAMTLLLTLGVAPAAEEALFRGLLYPLLRRRAGIVAAVLVSAISFATMHGNVVQFAAVLPMAVLLGLVYERTRRLWPCVLIHAGFNVATIIVLPRALTWLVTPAVVVLLLTAFLTCAFLLYLRLPSQVKPVAGNAWQGSEPR